MTPDNSLLHIGEVVSDRYRIEQPLGEGGMGVVFLARQLNLDRVVAIKILRPQLAIDPVARTRFEREARAAATLDHPGVIKIFDFGEHNGLLYLTMERIVGMTLRQLLRATSDTLPIERAISITTQIADVLTATHAISLVHRDLKPENIFLVPSDLGQDRVVVADFGLAIFSADRLGERLTRTGEVMGTPAYLSPEQTRGKALGPKVDVYALGCILYEMITGTVPFDGPDVQLVMQQAFAIPDSPRERRPNLLIPQTLDSLVMAMLTKSPDHRPDAIAVRQMLLALDPEASRMLTPRNELKDKPRQHRMVTQGDLRTLTMAIDGDDDDTMGASLGVAGPIDEWNMTLLANQGFRPRLLQTTFPGQPVEIILITEPESQYLELANQYAVPTVVMAKNNELSHLAELIRYGVSEIVPHGSEHAELIRRIRRALRRSRRLAEAIR
ncbi:MAG: serine/threonine protein kinase [Myxococcales bacterium]|nr:serine/threonine protein kinase [Myxococcales bacterium]